jgi:antitoxin VapB
MDTREHRAKLFKSGGSQAVRLPKDFRFERQREVVIRREGDRVVLEPVRSGWSRRFRELAGSAADFPRPAEPLPPDPGPDLE